MKFHYIFLGFFLLFLPKVYSHSGGTDSHGCHAGTQPYHCHNGESSSYESAGVSGWDFNFGYQYHANETQLIPYAGLSLGKSDHHEDASLGVDFGLKHQSGFYAGYVTTSQSLQLGYHFLHLSANSDFIGLGIRFSFDESDFNNQSSIYSSGSALFSSE